jgi:hypothetical protein
MREIGKPTQKIWVRRLNPSESYENGAWDLGIADNGTTTQAMTIDTAIPNRQPQSTTRLVRKESLRLAA